jgi:hypothetical protein
MHKYNFIWGHKKSTAFPAPIFIKTYKYGIALPADLLYTTSFMEVTFYTIDV